MKYEARKAPLYQDQDGDVWEVIERPILKRTRVITFLTSESKAKVFAWALNSIANKHQLAHNGATGHPDMLCWYDGPTEGIAD